MSAQALEARCPRIRWGRPRWTDSRCGAGHYYWHQSHERLRLRWARDRFGVCPGNVVRRGCAS